ncbi:MAG: hypothetical protein JWM99_1966 [Verrucomicrobiales bacterium]|nr:hypothetical protein [Verrucomicrobiales bacterium]
MLNSEKPPLVYSLGGKISLPEFAPKSRVSDVYLQIWSLRPCTYFIRLSSTLVPRQTPMDWNYRESVGEPHSILPMNMNHATPEYKTITLILADEEIIKVPDFSSPEEKQEAATQIQARYSNQFNSIGEADDDSIFLGLLI